MSSKLSRRFRKFWNDGRQARRASNTQTYQRRLLLEALEDRRLLAASPQLLKDINLDTGGSNPASAVDINGTIYFRANDGVHGHALWRSDGTEAGTVLVKEITPLFLTNVNGLLFFTAGDATNGRELWKSDGTAAGTVLVKDINPGTTVSYPRDLTNVNGTLFFNADDGVNGRELWKSDGTALGTVMVKDINPGTAISYPKVLTNVNGTLFFSADGGVNGGGLWKSDGTEAGTVFVSAIGISNLVNVNGTLFLSASNGQLWKTDGTTAGTVFVKDILVNVSQPLYSLTNVNGTLFFSTQDEGGQLELWKSDGTEAGTVRVKDIFPGHYGSLPRSLTNVNGTLFFSARDDTSGRELWKSDGTEAGTVLVKDINPNGNSYPGGLTNVNGMLFFTASDGVNGGLWKSDGTEAGTVFVSAIGGDVLSTVNGTLFFSADAGASGVELWKSDGTEAGTVLVKDINTVSKPSYPASLTNVDGTLFFSATDGANNYELWKSDGTAAGSVLVKDINPSGSSYPISSTSKLTNVNGTLFFSANNGVDGHELWKSDGTVAGTVLVKDIFPGGNGSSPHQLANVNGTLFFAANDGENGIELWKSDGTAAGTVLVKDINFEGGFSYPHDLTNVDGTLFFAANDGAIGIEQLWKSDGTAGGTVLVKDFTTGQCSDYYGYLYPCRSTFHSLTNVNGVLFFQAHDDTNGRELWKSDGTTAGTVVVQDINPGSGGSYIQNLTNVNGTLFFGANDYLNGLELWKSDGTAAGTTLVKDIYEGGDQVAGHSDPRSLANVNGTLYFSADDGSNGRELWKSDGTEAGTVLVQDVNIGTGGSNPASFTFVNGTLFFSADDGLTGVELWTLSIAVTSVSGTAGNDTITIDPGTAPGSVKATVNGVIQDNIQFNGTLPVVGLGGNDAININASLATGMSIDGGDGADTITINAGNLAGPVNVADSGPTGDTDLLTVNGTPGNDTITKTLSQVIVVSTSTATVNYAGIEQFSLDGKAGGDSYSVDFGGTVQSVTAVADSGPASDLDTLNVNGTTSNDFLFKSTGFVQWKPLGDSVFVQRLDFDNMDLIILRAGAGNDTIHDPGASTQLFGGLGDDTIIIDATTGDGVSAFGEEGSDTFIINLGSLAGPVTVNDNVGTNTVQVIGTPGDDDLTLTSTETSSQLATGTGETISFNVGGATSTALEIDGGGGTNNVTVQGDPPPVQVTATHVAPVVATISAPLDPKQLSIPINASATFSDLDLVDSHTAVWNWGDGTSSPGTVTEPISSTPGFVSGSHPYVSAGVYTITLTVTDQYGATAQSVFRYIVVYDPSAGFVTGGGWINSPAGAYSANPALTGKANFGFNSKYQNGNNVPTGNTEFQFKAGDFNFKSSSYEWLVISGAKARFRGVGTVNGAGSYGFELTAWDGQAPGGGGEDRFRIKIWNGNQGNGVVYDNMMGATDEADPTTALGGGSIVIHKNAQALLASRGVAAGKAGGTLSQELLNQAVDQTINYWRNTGVDSEAVSNLQQIHVAVADLSESVLGIASDTDYVWIDRDAAGYGWQFDSLGTASPSVTSGMDLLSVVAHELGHKLGWEHSDNEIDLMAPALHVGVRPLVSLGQPIAFFNTRWALPSGINSDVARLSSPGTTRLLKEDSEEFQAHNELFASLGTARTKPGLRRAIMEHKSKSDARQIPDPEQEDLLEDDVMEVIAQARLTARQR